VSDLQLQRTGAALEAVVEEALETALPIIAGPWFGSVGFEVLYWIPILHWAVRRWPELRERLVIVSRGGVESWYEGIAWRYADLFDLYDERSFGERLQAERRTQPAYGFRKQVAETEWELEIADRVSESLGEPRLPLIHPSILYRVLKLPGLLASLDDAAFTRWPGLDPRPLETVLPERYVAVRFYRNPTFSGPAAEGFARAVIAELTKHTEVVMLNTRTAIDPKHPDVGSDERVIPLAPHMSFRDNLGIQSIAISNAAAFVGTYGGLSFLPPNYGVPTFAFWSTTTKGSPDTKKGIWRDLDLAERAFSRPGLGAYRARSCRDTPLQDLLAPIVAPVRVDEAPAPRQDTDYQVRPT
jgi:hypothetical protein